MIARSAGLRISGIAGKIGSACLHEIITKNEAEEKLYKLLIIGRINQDVYNEIVKTLSKPHW